MILSGMPQRFAHSFTQRDLILYAGTNLLCPSPGMPAVEQMGMMPVIGSGREKQQPNVDALADLEQRSGALLCDIFHGTFAEARFQSCTQANLAVFTSLLSPGDTVVCLQGNDGGHPSQNGDGMLAHLPVKLLSVPFDSARQCIDDTATALLVQRTRPRVVVIGPSVVLRPSVFTQTAAATAETGAALIVDVSHVAGLIAGGVFPNPLDDGADLITASSYKTLGCPPSGFIVGRHRVFESRLTTSVSPKLVSNYDAGRLFRFTTALAGLRSCVSAYAQAILVNTAALRKALLDQGIPVLTPADGVFGTHQIVVMAKDKSDAIRVVAELQKAGITTSLCGVPGKAGSWGIRLGTQLITRRGMGAEQMTCIAWMIAQVIRQAGHEALHREVQDLTGEFRQVWFCEGGALHGC